jgi:hypothetical protein
MKTMHISLQIGIMVVALVIGACGASSIPVYPDAEMVEPGETTLLVYVNLLGAFLTDEEGAHFGTPDEFALTTDPKPGQWLLAESYCTDDTVEAVYTWYNEQLPDRWERRAFSHERGTGYLLGQPREKILGIFSDNEGVTRIALITLE